MPQERPVLVEKDAEPHQCLEEKDQPQPPSLDPLLAEEAQPRTPQRQPPEQGDEDRHTQPAPVQRSDDQGARGPHRAAAEEPQRRPRHGRGHGEGPRETRRRPAARQCPRARRRYDDARPCDAEEVEPADGPRRRRAAEDLQQNLHETGRARAQRHRDHTDEEPCRKRGTPEQRYHDRGQGQQCRHSEEPPAHHGLRSLRLPEPLPGGRPVGHDRVGRSRDRGRSVLGGRGCDEKDQSECCDARHRHGGPHLPAAAPARARLKHLVGGRQGSDLEQSDRGPQRARQVVVTHLRLLRRSRRARPRARRDRG